MARTKPVPCERCGAPRLSPRKDSPLCPDCKYVLTKEEAEAWKDKVAA